MLQETRTFNDRWIEAAKSIHSLESFRKANQTVGYNLVRRIPDLLEIIDERDATIKGLVTSGNAQRKAIEVVQDELHALKTACTNQPDIDSTRPEKRKRKVDTPPPVN